MLARPLAVAEEAVEPPQGEADLPAAYPAASLEVPMGVDRLGRVPSFQVNPPLQSLAADEARLMGRQH
jgi:hypothetical protein